MEEKLNSISAFNFNDVDYKKEEVTETSVATTGKIEIPNNTVNVDVNTQEVINNKKLSTNNIVETTKEVQEENINNEVNAETSTVTENNTSDITDAVQTYADKISVPVEYLKEKWHITENAQGGISISYLGANEEVIDTKIIDKNNQSSWENGKEPIIYGEWRLNKYTDDYIIVVHNEENAHVLWSKGIQGIALTKTSLSVDTGIELEKFKEVWVFRDGSDFTDVLYSRLQNIVNKNKLYSIDAPNFKYKDFVELNVNGELKLEKIQQQKFKLIPVATSADLENHVGIGNKVINDMQLVSYSNELYAYDKGVYSLIDDNAIVSYIIKFIRPDAKSSLCKQVIYYIRHVLDEADVEINHDVINYRNGYYDLVNREFIEHTSEIFTINQLGIDYIDITSPNETVDKFLKDISNNNVEREKGLLQLIGYCQTTRNNIQKFSIFYGPKGSNGKSFTLKVIEKMVGKENVSHKGMELLAEGFEVKGIKGKQLNISFELPVTKIKDTSVLKATTTGDTIETKVKFNPDTLVIKSYVKHIFATNYLPEVTDKTNGFYRRVHIIPFENQFSAKNNTFNEDEFLSKENLDYLGRRALDEYLEMLDSGKLEFANEEESNNYVREFENLNDSVKAFITQEEFFPEDISLIRPRTEFMDLYKIYCSENLMTPVGKKQFYRELTTKYRFYIKPLNGTYFLCRDPKADIKN